VIERLGGDICLSSTSSKMLSPKTGFAMVHNADVIFVVSHGRVVEIGVLYFFVKERGMYYRMVCSL
jgi:hypothetical protein